MRILTMFFLTLIAARAGEALQVTWATRHAAAPVQLRPPVSDFLPIFRAAIQAAPESSIIPLALSQPAWLGLTSEQAERLKPLIAERYRLIDQSPQYSKAASALPYCFSQSKPVTGFASLYLPDNATTNTPVELQPLRGRVVSRHVRGYRRSAGANSSTPATYCQPFWL